MFIRFSSLFSVAALAAVAVAAPSALVARGDSQCTTGPNNCCSSVQSPTSQATTLLAGLLKADLSGVTANVGLICNPIMGGQSCTQQPVCCNGNNFSGLIVVGCTPVNVL